MWREKTMSELFSLKHGFAFDGKFFAPEGEYILLTPGNFHDEGGFKFKSKEKYFTGDFDEQYLLPKGSLIVAMTEQAEGLLGSSAIIPESGRFLHNQRLGLVTKYSKNSIDLRFLYYLFNSRDVRTQIRACATGTKVRHTSPSRIGEVKVSVPDLKTQCKIASILSAYDDLIENNTRRIAILEEMVQAIYREWFVHFRFPGHENVKLVDSPLGQIPEGWKPTKLIDITKKIGSGATPRGGKEAYKESGITLIRSLNVYDNNFEDKGLAFIDEQQAAQLDNVTVKRHDILLNITGASVARCCMVRADLLPARVNQHVAIIRTDKTLADPFYVLSAINSERHKMQLLSLAQGGATREALTKTTIQNFEIVLPDPMTLRAFGKIAGNLFEQREILQRKNKNLGTTRDLLLPKLVSGEIDVDDLDIDTGELAEEIEEATA